MDFDLSLPNYLTSLVSLLKASERFTVIAIWCFFLASRTSCCRFFAAIRFHLSAFFKNRNFPFDPKLCWLFICRASLLWILNANRYLHVQSPTTRCIRLKKQWKRIKHFAKNRIFFVWGSIDKYIWCFAYFTSNVVVLDRSCCTFSDFQPRLQFFFTRICDVFFKYSKQKIGFRKEMEVSRHTRCTFFVLIPS